MPRSRRSVASDGPIPGITCSSSSRRARERFIGPSNSSGCGRMHSAPPSIIDHRPSIIPHLRPLKIDSPRHPEHDGGPFMHPRAFSLGMLFILPVATPAQGRGGAPEAVTLLVPARVWDGTVEKNGVAAKPHEGWAILVRGERITAVGPRAQLNVPNGA